METKTCNRCGEEKPIGDYLIDHNKPDKRLKNPCKSCRNQYSKVYAASNPEKVKTWRKTGRARNKKSIAERHRRYKEANKDKFRDYARKHYENNKEKHTEKSVLRKTRRELAKPSWLTKENLEEIEYFYWLALDLKISTGLEYHVDHIIPLRGKTVCGLHVPWNLQILSREDNLKKGNKICIAETWSESELTSDPEGRKLS